MNAASKSTANRSASGDADRVELFMQLYNQHQRRLYLFLLAMIRNAADAEELLQETNLIMWRKFEEFDAATDFGAWANRIAYLECLKYRERRGNKDVPLGEEFIQQVAQRVQEEPDLWKDRTEALSACLDRLPPKDRELITRRYQAGSSGASVAEELGRTAHSVYKSITRIRRLLLDCINRRLAEEESR